MLQLPRNSFDQLMALWRQWRGEGGGLVPAKAQIDPRAMPGLLPYISIIEFDTDYAVYTRLIGTFFRDLMGEELTGKPISVLAKFKDTNQHIPTDVFKAFLEHPCGLKSTRRFPAKSGDIWIFRVLCLPLADSDGRCTFAIYTMEMEHVGGTPHDLLDPAALEIEKGSLIGIDYVDLGYGIPEEGMPARSQSAVS